METNPKPTALFLLVPWSCADTEQATTTGLSRGKHSVYAGTAKAGTMLLGGIIDLPNRRGIRLCSENSKPCEVTIYMRQPGTKRTHVCSLYDVV